MPEGVIAEVIDGYATIEFIDPELKGPALSRLLAIGGPESIETMTRQGPRRRYRVPEGNASEAGLLDVIEALPVGDSGFADALAEAHLQATEWESPQPSARTTYVGETPAAEVNNGDHHVATVVSDHGPALPLTLVRGERPEPQEPEPAEQPSIDWKRDELDDYARGKGIETPENLPNKQAVLDAIHKAPA
jgi:hypothetical protein